MTALPRFCGRLADLSAADRALLVSRARREVDRVVSARVAELGEQVRAEGDAALLRLTRELDGVSLATLEVDPARCRAARDGLDAALRRALERARDNLERVHRAFLPGATVVESEPGVRVGRRPEPLAAVGVYAPGGRAAYPSSVLMGAVPARVAGVREVVVCSPPSRATGLPSEVVLGAAAIAGADRVFAVGGAQAVLALAYGTATVPRVDRIVGPGNAWVAEAKRQVAGFVGIDAPAGPSEILILADGSADPALIARELIAQAEHDPEASCVALVCDADVCARARAALAASVAARAEVVDSALASRSALLEIDDLEQGLAFAEEYAAEHVLLALRDPEAALPRVRHAGTVFFGAGASVAFGDYLTGANHVLPTAGAGRSFSGLSTLDFMRFTTWQDVSRDAAARMADDVGTLADAEGLPGHAAAARAYLVGGAPSAARAPRARAKASYGKLHVYSSNRRPAAIDLSDNTNTLGPPPGARALLAPEEAGRLSRYPSHYADELKQAAARHYGVTPEEIVTGCGSDDVLDCAVRAFTDAGDAIAFPDPTFAMLPHFAHANGAVPVAVPLRGPAHDWDVDLDAMLACRPRVLYLCSPNNPTGTLVRAATIERALREAPGLVVVDEAYVEYGGESLATRARAEGRLLVVRTLSKAWGLAGQRVGVAIAAPELVAEIEKARGPYKVTGLGEAMAAKALREDGEWVAAGVRDVLASRARFVEWLRAQGRTPLPSQANFVLVPAPGALEVATRLRERGIAVRPFVGLSGIGDALRISIGPWPLMEQILGPLAEALCG